MKILYSTIILFLIIFTTTNLAFAKPLSLNEIGEASCRVHMGNAYGSGTAIHKDDKHVYVLTNAHVVGGSRSGSVEFFRWGRKTAEIPAQVIWVAFQRNTTLDLAVLRIDLEYFGNYPPRIISLAPRGTKLKSNDYIASAGCPEARWLQLWEGYVSGTDSRVYFMPPPLGGQSGSGIHTVINGKTYLAAVLTWRIENQGGAIPISTIRSAIDGQMEYSPIPSSYEWVSMIKLWTLGSDNIYYEQDGNGVAYLPHGVRAIRRNVALPSGFFGRGRGGNDNIPPVRNNNPFGSLPPGFGEDGDGDGDAPDEIIPEEPNPKIKELEDAINKLKADYEALAKEHDKVLEERDKCVVDFTANSEKLKLLQQTLEKLKEENKSLIDQNDLINSELNMEKISKENITKEYQIEIETYISSVKNLEERITKQEEICGNLELQLNLRNEELIEKRKEIVELTNRGQVLVDDYNRVITEQQNLKSKYNEESSINEENVKNLEFQRNTGIGGGILGVVGVLLWWMYDRKKKVKAFVENGVIPSKEEIPIPPPPPIQKLDISPLNNIFNNLLDTLNAVNNNLSVLCEKNDNNTQLLVNKIRKRDAPIRELGSKLIGLKDQIDTVSTRMDYLEKNDFDININNNNNKGFVDPNLNESQIGNYKPIRELFRLKIEDGEDPKSWALYGRLYQEAVGLLRKDYFKINITQHSSTVILNQRAVADKIDEWVIDEFSKRINIHNIDNFSEDKLLREAYTGFLYKEAVDMLRQGKLKALNHAELADAIENWVRKRFLEKIGIKF